MGGPLRSPVDSSAERAPKLRPNFLPEKPMPIQTGDAIPSVKLMQATDEGPKEVDTAAILGSGTAVLFGVPGAFTPTCSAKHLPGFVQQAAALKAKGVDTVACVAVNDAFVMAAWGREQGVNGEVTMLADGSANFIKALGLEMDLTARGMGVRSQRFALIAKDGKVTYVGVEQPGAFEVSSAETVLAKL
jgi:peroxiredoxin (alkyl hydroperoxide reductase subunit C)